MPKFTVEHACSKPSDAAFEAIKTFLSQSQDVRKFDSHAVITFDEAQKVCFIKGSQFKAEMRVVTVNAGSKVAIQVDLPLLMTPFRGKVEETLKRMLAKHLG